MHPDRWRLVEQLFESGVDLRGEARAAFLREKCAGDDGLLREIESLLENHAGTDAPRGRYVSQYFGPFVPALWPGDIVSNYRIIRSIADGGMGRVYLASDLRLDRNVALKTLLPDVVSAPDNVRRFVREAKAASALNHPNIITIYEFGRDRELHFITSEFVEGSTLRERMSAGPVPAAEAVRICRQVAEGLAAAHQAGIIHRDLKPENLMVRADGYVKILDFGLAHSAANLGGASSALETCGQAVLGTIPYMSPEQTTGSLAGQASDLWSLGVILYELVSRRHPFAAPTIPETVANIRAANPPMGDTPSAFHGLIRSLLEPDPKKRLQSASDLAHLLKSHEAGLRGNTKPSWIAAALLTTAAVVTSGWILSRHITPREGRPVMTLLTDVGNVELAALSPDRKLLAYVAAEDAGQTLRLRQIATRSELSLVPAQKGATYHGVAFSPDGVYVYYTVYAGAASYIYRVPVIGGTSPSLVIDDADSTPALSPDGRRIAVVRGDLATKDSFLLTGNSDGTEPRVLAQRRKPNDFLEAAISWSPDGDAIVVGSRGVHGGVVRDLVVRVDANTAIKQSY